MGVSWNRVSASGWKMNEWNSARLEKHAKLASPPGAVILHARRELPRGVTVAQEILNLFDKVQILAR